MNVNPTSQEVSPSWQDIEEAEPATDCRPSASVAESPAPRGSSSSTWAL